MGEPIDGNEAQGEYWERRSSSWIEAEDYTNLVTGPFGRRAMDRLAVEAGVRVLDVGCGTGPTTIELARRVSPGGAAVGIDIAPSMLTVARARAATRAWTTSSSSSVMPSPMTSGGWRSTQSSPSSA